MALVALFHTGYSQTEVQAAGLMNEPSMHKAALFISSCTTTGALQWCQDSPDGPDSPVVRTSAQAAAGEVLNAGNNCAHAEPSVHTTEEVNADRATASWRQTPAHVEQKCMRDFQEGSEARCWSTICVLLENLRKAWKICLYGFRLIEELLMNLYLSSVGKVC